MSSSKKSVSSKLVSSFPTETAAEANVKYCDYRYHFARLLSWSLEALLQTECSIGFLLLCLPVDRSGDNMNCSDG